MTKEEMSTTTQNQSLATILAIVNHLALLLLYLCIYMLFPHFVEENLVPLIFIKISVEVSSC